MTAVLLKPGNLLLRTGAPLPAALTLEKHPFTRGWSLLAGESATSLERRLRAASALWNLFWLAGEARGSAFARSGERALQRAFAEAVAQLDPRLNCAEITGVRTRSLLGLHYATLTVQGRHVQKGFVLFQPLSSEPENAAQPSRSPFPPPLRAASPDRRMRPAPAHPVESTQRGA